MQIIKKTQDFFTQVLNELKKVKWPTRKNVKNLTFVVLGTLISVGLYISLLDIAFTKLIELGIN